LIYPASDVLGGREEGKLMKAAISLMRRLALVVLTVWLLLFFLRGSVLAQEDSEGGAVYVLTNLAQGNAVVVFHRNADGTLTRMEEVATGGLGSGPGELPPGFGPGPGPNPLDSQDGLVLTEDGRFLLAVNSKSNDVSVFAVHDDYLRLVDRTPTDGNFPVSVAHKGGLVYVLNEGESPDQVLGGVPSITGFLLDITGKLHKIPNSTRAAGAPDSGPSEIAFSHDGRYLITTEMFTNQIKVFALDEDGMLKQTSTIRANNSTPLAVALGHDNLVVTTEGNDTGHRVGSPNGATVSSYRLNDDGTLEAIDRAISVNKTGTCWVRFSPDDRFAFTGDSGSGTVSSFAVSREGGLTLLGAVDTGGVASVPIDLTVTPNGKFLYVLASFKGKVEGFRIGENGSLTSVGSASGLPITIQGIASR
jgi:6-phosphogluconolactonase